MASSKDGPVISDVEFHMWLNHQTGEFERCEFDASTNEWCPMDVDDEGNWHRRQSSLGGKKQPGQFGVNEVTTEFFSPWRENYQPTHGSSVNPLSVTNDEVTLLELLAKGLSNPEIAKRLNKSPVETSLMTTDLLTRFKVETKDELARSALEKGLIPPG